MVSIADSLSELERSHKFRELVLKCYSSAIRNVARYAVELDEAATALYRKYLEQLAAEVDAGVPERLAESRSTLRGLLRDYRDKAAEYINGLREQLAESAAALEQIVGSLPHSYGDHEGQIRTSLQRLHEISASPVCAPVRGALCAALESIERSVEEMRKRHQFILAEFQAEIRVLHKRIDRLEAAAMIDSLRKFPTRAEIEDQLRASGAEWFCLLLIRVNGLQAAQRQYGEAVVAELAGAFGKRLRNSLPEDAVIGRWSESGFIAKVTLSKADAMSSARWISENLSGSYACLQEGKSVLSTLQVSVAVVDRSPSEPVEKTLLRAAEFFG